MVIKIRSREECLDLMRRVTLARRPGYIIDWTYDDKTGSCYRYKETEEGKKKRLEMLERIKNLPEEELTIEELKIKKRQDRRKKLCALKYKKKPEKFKCEPGYILDKSGWGQGNCFLCKETPETERKRIEPEEKERKKKLKRDYDIINPLNLPLILGIGGGIILLIVFIIILAGSKKNNKSGNDFGEELDF